MATRSLSQIVQELNASSQPQINSLTAKKKGLTGELQADEQALAGQQTRAFGDILTGSRRRGLGFSGIPLGEQAQYTADVYLPTLARTRNDFRNRELSLEDAIQGIYGNNRNQAQTLYQSELDRAEQIRQFNENMALQREAAARQARAAADNGAPAWLQALLGQSQNQTQENDANARYQAWLNSQRGLRVNTSYAPVVSSGKNGKLQGSGVRLQGGTPRLQGGGIRLQGKGATTQRLYTAPKRTGGLRVT